MHDTFMHIDVVGGYGTVGVLSVVGLADGSLTVKEGPFSPLHVL